MARTQKHAFSKKALMTETPMWAKVMFRIIFLLTSTVVIFIGATSLLTAEAKAEWMLALNCVSVFVYGLSKMFGIEVKDE